MGIARDFLEPIKKKYPSYPPRREDPKKGECDYKTLYEDKDKTFYEKYCPDDMQILSWYNQFIRTGCEFFVSNGLLIYFLKNYLFNDENSLCDIKKDNAIVKENNQVSKDTQTPDEKLNIEEPTTNNLLTESTGEPKGGKKKRKKKIKRNIRHRTDS